MLFTALIVYLSVVFCGPNTILPKDARIYRNCFQDASQIEIECSEELTIQEISIYKKDLSRSLSEKDKYELTAFIPQYPDEDDYFEEIDYINTVPNLSSWLEKCHKAKMQGDIKEIVGRDFPTKIAYYGKSSHGSSKLAHWDLHRSHFRFFAWPEGFALIHKTSTDKTPGAILDLIAKDMKNNVDYRELVSLHTKHQGNFIGVFDKSKHLYLQGHNTGYRVYACRNHETLKPGEPLCDVLSSTGKKYILRPFVTLLIAPNVLNVDETWDTCDPYSLAKNAAEQLYDRFEKTFDVFAYLLHPQSKP